MGMICFAVVAGNPTDAPIGVTRTSALAEVASQQAELPHVVSDVLAHVTDGAVRAHNHFLILFRDRLLGSAFGDHWRSFCRPCPTHHPAALVFPLALVRQDTGLFEFRKGGIPEVQMKDLTFARKEV